MPDKASVQACSRCGRMFQYSGFGPICCASCREFDNLEFDKVRDYLNEHGNASSYEISQATGVTEKTIRRYLMESRLEIPEGSPIFIQCSICGCDIRSGKYCIDCANRLSSQLQGAFIALAGEKAKTVNENAGKMHVTKNRDSKREERRTMTPRKKDKNPEEDQE
ncbi:MAG: MerR family transcriptional regulator [Lachnospiraceae bacterium]|nr:MerR family transcriptional regulator [Lachnospiraceae bacterium]